MARADASLCRFTVAWLFILSASTAAVIWSIYYGGLVNQSLCEVDALVVSTQPVCRSKPGWCEVTVRFTPNASLVELSEARDEPLPVSAWEALTTHAHGSTVRLFYNVCPLGPVSDEMKDICQEHGNAWLLLRAPIDTSLYMKCLLVVPLVALVCYCVGSSVYDRPGPGDARSEAAPPPYVSNGTSAVCDLADVKPSPPGSDGAAMV